jgi:hypothetical protein
MVDQPMPRGNRYLQAFKESFNVVGLTTVVAVSAATLNPLPLLAGLVAEAVYLLFVSDSRWYEARLSRRYDAEVEQRRQALKDQVLPTLRPSMQARFARLEEMRRQIDAQPVEGQTWYREVLRKLDYLLEKFLQFASKEAQFRCYLQSLEEELRGAAPAGAARVDDFGFRREEERRPRRGRGRGSWMGGGAEFDLTPGGAVPLDGDDRWVEQTVAGVQAHYDAEMADLRQQMEREQDPSTRDVLQKRLDVIQRRHEFAGKIGKILANLSHQLKLLEDTFGLINDELRARSPEQILSDIEDVVWQTDTMTKLLDEMAPYEQLAARL